MLSEGERQAAAAITHRHQQRVARARAADHLTPEAKRARIAKSHLTAANEMAELQRQSHQRRNTEAADAMSRMWGLKSTDPAAVISYRDAQDRASALTSAAEAHRMLADRGASDPELVRAVAQVAWNRSQGDPRSPWAGVVTSWIQANPEQLADAQILASALDGGTRRDQLAERLSCEIQRVPEIKSGHLPAIAAAADTEDSTV